MSISNASRKAPAPEDIPSPNLSDVVFESGLRAAGVLFTVSLDRQGRRTLGGVFPQQSADPATWEADLADLSRVQGLDQEGHSLERQQAARGRPDEPTANPATTSRTLRRG